MSWRRDHNQWQQALVEMLSSLGKPDPRAASMIHSDFGSNGVWVNTITGRVDLLQLFGTAFRWFEHPEFRPDIPVLWDARDGYLDISYEELVSSHLPRIERVNTDRPAGKTAWLISRHSTHYIITNIIEQVAWAADWRAFLGTDTAEAMDWLVQP